MAQRLAALGNGPGAYVLALVAGLISSFSPCVLSSVPLVIAYVGGTAGANRRLAWMYSLSFCIGVALTLTALGAAAATFGHVFSGFGRVWNVVLALLMILIGLALLGVLRLNLACPIPRPRRGLAGAFAMGILAGVLASPCATPVLAAILAVVAKRGDAAFGAGLLAAYSLGHTALLLVAGTSAGFVQWLTDSPATRRWGTVAKGGFGFLVLIGGLYLLYLAL